MCDMTHSQRLPDETLVAKHLWHDPSICVGLPMHRCAKTHSYVFICLTHMCSYVWRDPHRLPDEMLAAKYVWHDWFICVTWLNHTRDGHIWSRNGDRTWLVHMCLFVWQDSCVALSGRDACCITCMTWPIYLCDMTQSNTWRQYFITQRQLDMANSNVVICVTQLVHSADWTKRLLQNIYDMTDSYVRYGTYDSIIHVTWLFDRTRPMHMCWYAWHDWFTSFTRRDACRRIPIHICHITHLYECQDSLLCVHMCGMTYSQRLPDEMLAVNGQPLGALCARDLPAVSFWLCVCVYVCVFMYAYMWSERDYCLGARYYIHTYIWIYINIYMYICIYE